MPHYVCGCGHEDDEQVVCPGCNKTMNPKIFPAAEKKKTQKPPIVKKTAKKAVKK